MAVLFVLLILVLAALAASPVLHHELHHDSDEPDHECAITLFAQAQVLPSLAGPALVLPVLAVVCLIVPLTTIVFLPTRSFVLPPGCGPPAFLR